MFVKFAATEQTNSHLSHSFFVHLPCCLSTLTISISLFVFFFYLALISRKFTCTRVQKIQIINRRIQISTNVTIRETATLKKK